MARSERVSYWRGKHLYIPSEVVSGRLLFEEDTGNVFLDYKDYLNTGELIRVQLTDSTKMGVSGGSFTGPVFLYRVPEEDMEAAPKSYVDAVDRKLVNHDRNEIRHITEEERVYWNDKVDSVTYTPNQISGHRLGVLSINNDDFVIYAPITTDIEGNAATATRLKNAHYIDGVKFDGTRDIVHFIQCDTPGEEQIKVIEVPDFKLVAGSEITVLFTYDNTAEELRLKINDYDDLPLRYHRHNIYSDKFKSGAYKIVFTGSIFEIVGTPDTKYEVVTASEDGLMSSEDKVAFDNLRVTVNTLGYDLNTLGQQLNTRISEVDVRVTEVDTRIDGMDEKLSDVEEGANYYELPPATEDTIGGVKPGPGIALDRDGTIYITYNEIVEALGYVPSASETNLSDFVGATADTNGESGFVPAPSAGEQDSFLVGSGEWLPSSSFTRFTFQGPTTDEVEGVGQVSVPGVPGFVPAPQSGDEYKFLRGDGTWVALADNIEEIVVNTLSGDSAALKQLIINAMQDAEVANAVLSKLGIITHDEIDEIVDGS